MSSGKSCPKTFRRHFLLGNALASALVLASFTTPALAGIIALDDFSEHSVRNLEPDSPAFQIVSKAREQLSSGDRATARTTLKDLANNRELAHPDILFAELLIDAGLRAEAKAVLEELGKEDPKRPDVYMTFLELAVQEQRWFDGWNLAEIGSKLAPPMHWTPTFAKDVQARTKFLQAICCEGQRDWQQAFAIYEALRKDRPKSQNIALGLGRVTFHLGKNEDSVKWFSEARQLNPKLDPPQVMLAQLHDQLDQPEKAEASYRAAYQSAIGKDATRTRLMLARWLIIKNRARDAAELIKDPIADGSEDETERLFLRALVERMEGRYDAARQILSELQRQKPTEFAISNQLALVLMESVDEGLRARALQIASSNTRNLPRSADAWATLGWVQFRLGDRAAAEASLANAVQLGPLSRDTLHYLVEVKRAAGDSKAVELLLSSLKEAKGPDFFSR